MSKDDVANVERSLDLPALIQKKSHFPVAEFLDQLWGRNTPDASPEPPRAARGRAASASSRAPTHETAGGSSLIQDLGECAHRWQDAASGPRGRQRCVVGRVAESIGVTPTESP